MHSKLGGLKSIWLQRFGYNLNYIAHKRTELYTSASGGQNQHITHINIIKNTLSIIG